jgi:hypothetical protein
MIWKVIGSPTNPQAWSVALVAPLVNGDARVERIHPIEFDAKREADRAAARLNTRDHNEGEGE